LEELVRRSLISLLPRLRRFATNLTGDADLGDDLVQHASERALSRVSQWKPGTRLDSWLFRIIYNAWIDERRSIQSQSRTHLDAARNVVDDSSTAAAEVRVAAQEVLEALAKLPEEQRAVLSLVCVEGMAYRDVAEVLNIPVGTVMSRVARGRLAIAEQLDEPEPRFNNTQNRVTKLRGSR
jgi:RNA polymerase sigma-70 factor (ECF subfamily)